jgi:dihydrolipoamide dehydrogenase
VDQERVLDSDGILNLKRFPKRLMIIGAGIVGCEYATIFSNFGQTKVYLVDHMDRILPYEDDDVIAFVQNNLKNNGVDVLHSAELKNVVIKHDSVEATLEFAQNEAKVFEVDAILISVGRSPNLSQLNLPAIPLKANTNEDLKADDHCCVKKNIYCAGDVSVHPDLVNVAEMEARHAVGHMFGVTQKPLNYRNMSTVMFFYPAVGAVGYSERICQEKKIPYRVAYYANALLPRAIAMRAVNGFVKIIVRNYDDKMILGMRAAGPQVSSTMVSISYLMDQEKGISDILHTLHPHPTMSEGIQECLRVLLGTSVYKSKAFPDHIRIKAWIPGSAYTS